MYFFITSGVFYAQEGRTISSSGTFPVPYGQNSGSMFKHGFLHILLTVTCFLSAVGALAQSTRIKGRVTDFDTGEGVPFAAVFFRNTTVGVSADLDGYYSFETRDTSTTILIAQMLGYENSEKIVRLGSYNEINFSLKQIDNTLTAAKVKPDNSKAKRLLANIEKNRDRNNPDKIPEYECKVYTKVELDLTHVENLLKKKIFNKQIGFVLDYMDTSVVSGVAYLPAMISETVSMKYHSSDPSLDREVVEASKISGINDSDVNLSQYTGSLYLKTNFYDNFIKAFNISFPSPMGTNGDSFYNYYIIDSLDVKGEKTYQVRFHPKTNISSSAFDGEMLISTEDWGLREIHAKLNRQSNVNWVRDYAVDIVMDRTEDGRWFYKMDRVFADFSVTKRDSSKITSFLGTREMHYSDFKKEISTDVAELKKNSAVEVRKEPESMEEDYWDEARPYALSEKEKNIYVMVDSIKTVPLYKNIYYLVNTIATGYIDTKYVGIGQYYKFLSFNDIEGTRFRFGARTTAAFSRRIRLTGFVAYGTKDEEWKGGGTLEYMFSKDPTRKLTIDVSRDLKQLGRGSSAFSESSLFSSILTKSGSGKRSPINTFSIRYDHEINRNLDIAAALEHKRIFSNEKVPMVTPSGENVQSVAANQGHIWARYSWNETVTRGAFDKTNVGSGAPVFQLDLTGSVKGLAKNDYSYLRTELTVDYRLHLAPLGYADIRLNAGRIIGKVPYPLLKLHEGNGTYFLDRSSFTCMDFYEFASDTWVQIFWEHNLNGFILGKIPLIEKLNWREAITIKAAYGTLSEKNNGIIGSPTAENIDILFPEGMQSLNKPYVEAGFGITNIFKLFRIDFAWRLTHRHYTNSSGEKTYNHNFAATFGVELKF